MEPLPNNSRYILELERNSLLEQKYEFDQKYGTFSFAFLASLEAFALLVYLYIATILIYYKDSRTKTNFIVSVWAIINFLVLFEKLSGEFSLLFENDLLIDEHRKHLTEMLAALARFYGTSLAIVWLFTKYVGEMKPKLNFSMYFLLGLPALTYFGYVYYYFYHYQFIYEVYTPGMDILSTITYMGVICIFLLCRIFDTHAYDVLPYALMISIVNLITNFPSSLMSIYLRFTLDISWSYRFHIYFVDFFIDALQCSNAFMVLFIIILYNDNVRNQFFRRVKRDSEKISEVMTLKVEM